MNNVPSQDYFLAFLRDDELNKLLYLLEKIGFKNNEILKEYINELYNKHKPNYTIEDSFNECDEFGGSSSYDYVLRECAETARTVLFDISMEYDFKINKKKKLEHRAEGVDYRTIEDFAAKHRFQDYITASDIANYIFCPVRYCISKTFVETETEATKTGTILHSQNRLAYVTVENEFAITGEFVKESIRNKGNEDFFNEIRNARILYIGHEKNSEKYFLSKKGKFVGQPDYVFENMKGEKFIVEEKFKLFSAKQAVLQNSHRAQLASYIMGIDEFNAQFGYIVYWHYVYEREYKREYESKLFSIKKCDVYKVDKSIELQKEIRGIYKSIISLNNGDIHEFDKNSLIAKKCVNCSVRKFCGHKTGRLDILSAPYSKDYYTLVSSRINGWSNSDQQ